MPLTPDVEYRFQRTFWLAMVISIIFYYVIMRVTPPQSATANPTLVNALLVAAVGLVGASFALKSRFMARAAETGIAQFRRMALIIAVTFCESAALLGIVIWFLTGSTRAYWFLILGLLGNVLHYPQRDA